MIYGWFIKLSSLSDSERESLRKLIQEHLELYQYDLPNKREICVYVGRTDDIATRKSTHERMSGSERKYRFLRDLEMLFIAWEMRVIEGSVCESTEIRRQLRRNQPLMNSNSGDTNHAEADRIAAENASIEQKKRGSMAEENRKRRERLAKIMGKAKLH